MPVGVGAPPLETQFPRPSSLAKKKLNRDHKEAIVNIPLELTASHPSLLPRRSARQEIGTRLSYNEP